MKGVPIMYFNFDDKVTHDARIFDYTIANNTNIRLDLKSNDKVIGFVTLMPPEISHIVRIANDLPAIQPPE